MLLIPTLTQAQAPDLTFEGVTTDPACISVKKIDLAEIAPPKCSGTTLDVGDGVLLTTVCDFKRDSKPWRRLSELMVSPIKGGHEHPATLTVKEYVAHEPTKATQCKFTGILKSKEKKHVRKVSPKAPSYRPGRRSRMLPA